MKLILWTFCIIKLTIGEVCLLEGKDISSFAISNLKQGLSFYKQGKYELAEVLLQRAFEENALNKTLYFYLGNIYYHKKKYDEAIGAYKRGLELAVGENKAIFKYNLGKAYEKNREYGEAKKLYQELSEKEGYEESYFNLGLLSYYEKDKKGIQRWWRIYLKKIQRKLDTFVSKKKITGKISEKKINKKINKESKREKSLKVQESTKEFNKIKQTEWEKTQWLETRQKKIQKILNQTGLFFMRGENEGENKKERPGENSKEMKVLTIRLFEELEEGNLTLMEEKEWVDISDLGIEDLEISEELKKLKVPDDLEELETEAKEKIKEEEVKKQ